MFVAIVGTRCAGKSTVTDFLVHVKKFVLVGLQGDDDHDNHTYADGASEKSANRQDTIRDIASTDPITPPRQFRPTSFLTMNSPVSSIFPTFSPIYESPKKVTFATTAELLDFATKNWRIDMVTEDLGDEKLLEPFTIRPFVMVLNVDAPILQRYYRSRQTYEFDSLEEFVRMNDRSTYGLPNGGITAHNSSSSLYLQTQYVHIHIINTFDAVSALYTHLEELDITNPEHLRPGWDTYFMQLASLAAQRSNCMKRRVGAILVRNNRILATGYNGTPRGLKNCNEGGCIRCNSASETSDECVCLHAEENALLEAGKERIGDGAVLYCNTCPCLKCTIKIIQTGVKEVVYNLSYKVDDASAALFNEANVRIRRHAPPPRTLPPVL
ncbi:hypothetical protein K474DRAFT_1615920 [Panus rudis PR-1116 ss-1]|nr:hypothetical protein K474DRAFT_1615920 [Panus rudis PR-1116 ss-1]